ncbi:hypothetical protein P152DRAFT_416443, partial [Eremomyces bilateralis CBS 781.70]
MSEVATRPSNRGRSSTRGGRGRGTAPRTTRQTNGHLNPSSSEMDFADQGELGEIKKKYLSELSSLKELFPDWTEVDLVFALQETDGDLNNTIERITEGTMSQFNDVKKKTKDRSRSKVNDATPASIESSNTSRPSRGKSSHDAPHRARSSAPRSRGAPRGRGGHSSTTGTRPPPEPVSVPTNESSAWGDPIPVADTDDTTWEKTSETAEPTVAPKTYEPPKTWASMFAKPKPTPTSTKKTAPEQVPVKPTGSAAEEVAEQNGLIDAGTAADVTLSKDTVDAPAPSIPTIETTKPSDVPVATAPDLFPSQDKLTENNVEHLPDTSHPAPTGTAASTVASSVAPSVNQAVGRTPVTGYSAVAMKAAGIAGRSASFTRRVQEQQEAVVMPGNHPIDRATVQFGSLGLNGDSEALDVDDEREELETRAQPPQHSPVTQPRTALPPSRQFPAQNEPSIQPGLPTPKQTSSLPQPNQIPPQSIAAQQGVPQPGPSQQYSQFGRYGQATTQPELPSQQKAYDPFGPPQSQQSAFEQFQNQTTQAQQSQAHAGPQVSASSDYPNYYASEQSRGSQQNYYGAPYGQQPSSQQDSGATQQRTGSAFGVAPSDSSFGTSQAPQAPSRYGEPQTSGQNTPNPTISGQQNMGSQSHQSQHAPQPHQQNQYGSGAPFGNPYYNSHYYNAYMNQFGGFQGGYGPYGKSGMYGQPHHNYGMSPQTSYDQHSSSPGTMAGFGQSSMHGREGMSGGLSEYSRTGSSQPPNQQHSNSGFGAAPDVFSRSQVGFPSQAQYGQQGSGPSGSDDALKAYTESKGTSGPSQAALGQPGRPNSATNTAPGQTNPSGLPPTQSNQQGFG